RQVVDRFGETADLAGVERALPALLSIAEVCRESGDQPGEQLAVRELLSEIRQRRAALNADQEAFYSARLKRYPEAEPLFPAAAAEAGARPEAPPAAPPSRDDGIHRAGSAARAEMFDLLRAFAAQAISAEAPGYHR